MATYQVTAPDGGRYKITAPDTATEDDVSAIVQQQFGGGGGEDAQPQYSDGLAGWDEWIGDTAGTALQGMTLGFADEIRAGGTALGAKINSAITGNEPHTTYDQALKTERQRFKRLRQNAPAQAFGTELVGGLMVPGGVAAKAVTKAPTLAAKSYQGAKVGAGYGAAGGFGAGEGTVGNRLEGAATGAKYGAGLGAVLPGAVAAARKAYGAGRQVALPQIVQHREGPDAAADLILARRMKRSGTNPHDVAADMTQGRYDARMGSNSQAALPEMLADTSDDMRRMTGTVYRTGDEAGEIVENALEARQRGPENPYAADVTGGRGQIAEVLDALDRALEIRVSRTARVTERQLMADQSRTGQALYDRARENSEAFDLSPVLESVRQDIAEDLVAFPTHMRRALNRFERTGDNRAPISDVARFDNAKKALDDMIESAGRAGQPNLKRELTVLKGRLLDQVHEPVNGAPTKNVIYQRARDTWGSAAENREAIDLGRAALRESSEVSVEQFRELNEAQKRLFRIGFRESARNALGTKRPGNDVTQLFQQNRVRQLLSEVIPRSRAADGVFSNRPERWGNYMNRREGMVKTKNMATGGSPTARNQLDDVKGAADMLASAVLTVRGGANFVLEAVAQAAQRALGYNAAVSASLARKLTSTNHHEKLRTLVQIKRRMGAEDFELFTQSINNAIRRTTAGAAGPVAANVEDN